jgi:flagellar biosynthesis protein
MNRPEAQRSAIALTYSADEIAPRVVAKGRGLIAQTIIERAHQHGVYVHESKELVALLMQVDLDQRIPPALYRAVAELLVWVYRLEQGGLQAAITPAAEKSVASATKASDMP